MLFLHGNQASLRSLFWSVLMYCRGSEGLRLASSLIFLFVAHCPSVFRVVSLFAGPSVVFPSERSAGYSVNCSPGRLFRQLFSRPAGRVVTYSISIFWRRVVSVTLFLFKSFHFILSFFRFNLNQEWRLIFCLQ